MCRVLGRAFEHDQSGAVACAQQNGTFCRVGRARRGVPAILKKHTPQLALLRDLTDVDGDTGAGVQKLTVLQEPAGDVAR